MKKHFLIELSIFLKPKKTTFKIKRLKFYLQKSKILFYNTNQLSKLELEFGN
jgi:hypothetical protein